VVTTMLVGAIVLQSLGVALALSLPPSAERRMVRILVAGAILSLCLVTVGALVGVSPSDGAGQAAGLLVVSALLLAGVLGWWRFIRPVAGVPPHAGVARSDTGEPLRAKTEELALINSLNAALNSGAGLDELMESFGVGASRLLSALNTSVYTLDRAGLYFEFHMSTLQKSFAKKIRVAIGTDIPTPLVPRTGGNWFDRVARHGGPLITNDPDEIENRMREFEQAERFSWAFPTIMGVLRIRSVMTAPLMAGDDLVGMIDLSRDTPFDQRDAESLESLIHELTAVLGRKRLEEDLLELNATLESRVRDRTAELEAINLDLKAANETKDHFLSLVSHEFRTPLNSIIGFSSILSAQESEGLSEVQLRQLEMVKSSAQDLLVLVQNVLWLTEARADGFAVVPVPLGLRDHLEIALAGAMRAKGAAALEFDLDVDEETASLELVQDPAAFDVLLRIVVENAVKFTRDGGVTISARRPDDDHVAIRVADTGFGISEAELPRVFDEFRQSAGDPKDAKPRGMGAGLAVARHLAHLLHGEIGVASVLGQGSTFTVTLPIVHPGARG
jgi:signal transduction histidine kinase